MSDLIILLHQIQLLYYNWMFLCVMSIYTLCIMISPSLGSHDDDVIITRITWCWCHHHQDHMIKSLSSGLNDVDVIIIRITWWCHYHQDHMMLMSSSSWSHDPMWIHIKHGRYSRYLKAVLSDSKHHFNHVLHSHVQFTIIKNAS